jgi:hypothetical protein
LNNISLDLNLLAVLDALKAERSVTRAGGRLHMSQPTVSNVLTRSALGAGRPAFRAHPLGHGAHQSGA